MKVGILTSGGDCQSLNATIRGIMKGLDHNLTELEVYGFLDGYKGLIYGEYKKLTEDDVSGILTIGGTILGSSREPFKKIHEPDENGLDKVKAMKETYRRLELDCIVVLGGNGSQKTANLLREEGMNIIHLPKTIDNDLYGTDLSFGFDSAMTIATKTIDCIRTTAASHNRIFVVEIMGHRVGWLALYAGIAGGADVILIPEIPYSIDKIVDSIQRRNHKERGYTLIAMAEGALSIEDAQLSRKEHKEKQKDSKYSSPSYELASRITDQTGQEARVTVPGHVQRGGSPTPMDRVIATRIGSAAAQMVMNHEYGYMAAFVDGRIQKVPLIEVAGKIKTVPLDDPLIADARRIGITFGD